MQTAPTDLPSDCRLFQAEAGSGSNPAVLVLPGGGYSHLANHEGDEYARWLASVGVHALVVDYPVAPHQHPGPAIAAHRALNYLRVGDHGLEVDDHRIGVIGSSAGGHLAAGLATGAFDDASPSPRRPDFAILCYPVISFQADAHVGSILNLIGATGSLSALHAMSMEMQVDAETPPTFVWHTADDDVVSLTHALSFAEAMSRLGRPVELHVFPRGVHGLGLASDDAYVERWKSLCVSWMREERILRPERLSP